MFKLDYPKNFPDFIIPSIIAFGISMFLFFGMQMFYEYVFVTKNINEHIIKTTENLEDFNFISHATENGYRNPVVTPFGQYALATGY